MFFISVIFLGDWFLSLYGRDFVNGYVALIILAVGQLLNSFCGFVGFLMMMTGHHNRAALVLSLSCVLNLILNMLFIPLWGMTGAALATAISLICWNLCMSWYVRKDLQISPPLATLGLIWK